MDLPIIGINSPAVQGAVSLTPGAASKVQELLAGHGPQEQCLRIGARAGGCSGHSYFMEFCGGAGADDEQIESHGVKLVVDKKSALLLAGTVVDYVNGLMGAGFKFSNPNARHSCSCGESFTA
jgi:iron-sulfur cluster assembly protein